MEQRTMNVYAVVCTGRELKRLRKALKRKRTFLLTIAGSAGYFLYREMKAEAKRRRSEVDALREELNDLKQQSI